MKCRWPILFGVTFLFAPPVHANCFSGLQRLQSMAYQPQLRCTPDQIQQCYAEPPLLLILSVPNGALKQPFSELSSPDSRYRYLASLVTKTASSKQFWKYNCTALDLNPGSRYNCFDAITSELASSDTPAYDQGFMQLSSANGLVFFEYQKNTLPGYIAEYTCHPSDERLIQLRQYHVGPSVRAYFRDGKPTFQNPTGHHSVVLRITSFQKEAFVPAVAKKKKVGFTMDPAGLGPILNRVVPDSLR